MGEDLRLPPSVTEIPRTTIIEPQNRSQAGGQRSETGFGSMG